jgi:hypothetical protein
MLLRRFYMSENSNGMYRNAICILYNVCYAVQNTKTVAPNPKKKNLRVLKTDIPPPPTSAPLSLMKKEREQANDACELESPVGSTSASASTPSENIP